MYLIWYYNSIKYIKNKKIKYNYIISTSGPNITHFIAKYAKKINKEAIWISDFRDLWKPYDLIEKGLFLTNKIENSLEHSIIKDSDLIINISKPLHENNLIQ
ncbi:MAG: hypothetical protein U5N56_00775 [Candidatus Marinimicrobia bacterium]|nr:hypothetical protein [Candidatus Neomarinimicrobiota bacterium]